MLARRSTGSGVRSARGDRVRGSTGAPRAEERPRPWSATALALGAFPLLLALLSAPAQGIAADCPRPAEAARGPDSRSRAIAHYLASRRCVEAEDLRCAAAELQLAVDFDRSSAELRAALAEALAAIGDVRSAREEARCAVALSGGTGASATRAHVFLAQLARGRDREEAALELRRAIRVEAQAAAAGAAVDPEPWGLLATLYLELGDEAAAQRTLDDLASRAPGEGGALREVGRWLLEHGHPGRAEQFLRRAVALARGDLEAWRLLVRVHDALGRAPERQDDLEAVLQLQPDDPDALLALGRAALAAGDVDRARELLDRYRRGASDRAGAGAQVAGEWLAARRPAEALEVARDAREAADEDDEAELRVAEGLALLELRRFTEAARALEPVGEEAGDLWLEARAALAAALARAGKHAQAARALEAPLRAWPGDVRLELARAAALEWAGRTGPAAAALAQAADGRERLGEGEVADVLRLEWAELLCRSGRAPEAVAGLRATLAASPRALALRAALAAALVAAGNEAQAEAELRALLAIAPDDPEALARLAALLAGRSGAVQLAAAREGRSPSAGALDEALALARRAVEHGPRSPEAFAALGRVLSARGDHAAALASLDRAVALSGRSAAWLDALGEAYRAAGRRREAIAVWRAALQAAGDEPPAVAERLRAALRRKLRGGSVVAEGTGAR